MRVHYKCRCQSTEQTIDVPDRRPLGDLMEWMDAVMHCIHMDHHACSPRCPSTVMEYAKIPIDETTGGVGVPTTKN